MRDDGRTQKPGAGCVDKEDLIDNLSILVFRVLCACNVHVLYISDARKLFV